MAREKTVEHTQVAVVGGGPVGLLLAGELRLGGAEVVVLESLTEPSTESRASTLHARSMEFLHSRGLLDSIDTPPNEPRGHFGGLPLDLTLPSSHPGQWKVLQADLVQLLEKWADSLGVDIRRGQTVRKLVAGEGHVEVRTSARLRVRAEYVVACDGERSTVRALAGTPFTGTGATREMIRADVVGIDVPARRFTRLPRGLATSGKLPNGVTRIMVHEFGAAPAERTAEPDFAELTELWARVTGDDIAHGHPVWINAFDDTVLQVEGYRDGRILYAGDAAHRQMPIGGQALNLGLQDAANLGWKLAAEVTGRASPGLLDTYHEERHTAGARTLSTIRAQAQLLFGGPEVDPLRSVLGELMALPPVVEHLAGMVTGLDAGRRVPVTAAPPPAGRGLLLVSEEDAGLRSIAARWSGRVEVADAEATVLLRPDGEAAWLPGDDETVSAALQRWFGPPRTLAATPRGHSRILGVGGYRPRRSVPNSEICELIDTSEEWIESRSGIRARGFAEPDETLPMMAVEAAAEALRQAGITACRIDHVVAATSSNKVHMPALAAAIAEQLGAHGASGFDLNAACAGFCHALATASDAVCTGQSTYVLVVGVERMRDIVDPHDRGTSFLFADGAGAVVVGPSAEPGIGPVVRGASRDSLEAVRMTGLWDSPAELRPALKMDGRRVFRWSMTDVLPAARRAIAVAGLTPPDIAAFVPHQANERMITVMAAELGLPADAAVATDVRDSGNTSAASVPLALRALIDAGAVGSGAPALLMGFGSGLGYCGQVVLVP
jgi:oxygenase